MEALGVEQAQKRRNPGSTASPRYKADRRSSRGGRSHSVHGSMVRLPRNVEQMSESERLAWKIHQELNTNPGRSCKPASKIDTLLENMRRARAKVTPNKKRPLSKAKMSPRKKLP